MVDLKFFKKSIDIFIFCGVFFGFINFRLSLEGGGATLQHFPSKKSKPLLALKQLNGIQNRL